MDYTKSIIRFVNNDENIPLIISIGSCSIPQDPQQLQPNFATQLLSQQNTYSKKLVRIINIDTNFNKSEYFPSTINNIYVQKVSTTITSDNQQKIFDELKKRILTGKKTVIMSHTSPEMLPIVFQLAKDPECRKHMGENFEIIGSYFQDIPCFLYKPELFDKFSDYESFKVYMNYVWQNWRDKFDEKLGKSNQFRIVPLAQLQALRNQYQEIGTLFRNLATIPAQCLFCKYDPKQTPPLDPKLSMDEKEYQEYIQTLYQDKYPNEQLVIAAKYDDIETCKKLLNNAQLKLTVDSIAFASQRTALHEAAAAGSLNTINYLLSKGANFNAKDINGWTPMQFAIANHQLATIILLFAKGASLPTNAEPEDIKQIAIMLNNPEIISDLKQTFAKLYANQADSQKQQEFIQSALAKLSRPKF